MDEGFRCLGQEDLQSPVHPLRRQVEVRLVGRHGDPNRARAWEVGKLADGFFEDLALEDGTKDFRGSTKGRGQGGEVQGIFPFFQGMDFAGGENALLFQRQPEDGLGGLCKWVRCWWGQADLRRGGGVRGKTYLVGHGEHGVGQAGGPKDLHTLQEEVQVHGEAAAIWLALVGLEEGAVDGALGLCMG